MIRRTVVLTTPCHVSVTQGQLKVKSSEWERTVPLEDLGYLVVEQLQVTITAYAMSLLAANQVVVVFCDETHHPTGFFQAFQSHSEHSKRVQAQIACSEPLRKRLWQQCIQAKVGNQAMLLDHNGQAEAAKKLRRWVEEVRSGDPDNIEARAAQHYWRHFCQIPDFRRQPDGAPPNNLLNYGYAVIRAMIARALTGAGLLPVLGLHHHNKYNPYCLADDLMEPYRPFVDHAVLQFLSQGGEPQEQLTSEDKQVLLRTLVMDSQLEAQERPLLIAAERSAVSLAKCYLGEKRNLLFPTLF